MESPADPFDQIIPKTSWRGNRRSTFAQEYHASEREKQTDGIHAMRFKEIQPQKVGIENIMKVNESMHQGIAGNVVFTLGALMKLKKEFESVEYGKLNEERFAQVCMKIKEITAHMSEEEWKSFFMKIDVNDNGAVDWNDFSKYILLQQMAREEDLETCFSTYSKAKVKGKVMEIPSDSESEEDVEPFPIVGNQRIRKAGHMSTTLRPSNVIERILHLGAIQIYASCTQDGFLKLWHADSFKLLRTQKNGNGAWISDIVAMAQQPLAAFAMDRSVTFYDTGRLLFDVIGRIDHLSSFPMCATWVRTLDNDKLLYGDDDGAIHTFAFTDEWGGGNTKTSPRVGAHLLPGMSELEPWKIHTDWITRIKYLNHSSSLLSCSMDSTLLMLDLEKQKMKWSAKEHTHGIHSLDYCRTLNFIATCGLERHINIWNPFTAKIMGVLIGHQAPVLDVMVNERDNQVFSVSADNVIKVWDVRSCRCLQTLYEKRSHKSLDPPVLCRLLYDPNRASLVAAGSSLEVWNQKDSRKEKISRVSSALYNRNFNQVVIGRVDSLITIWNLEDGSNVFSFRDKNHKSTKISAMAFDSSARRLLIGGDDGSLRMWNFSNGQCLKEFKGFGQEEVSCVSCLAEGHIKYTAAAGWNGKVYIWEDGPREIEVVEHATHGHSDDVICMCFFPPNCFATAGYDGKVFVWKVDGKARCILLTPERESESELSNVIIGLLYIPFLDKTLAGCTVQGRLYFWRVPESKPIFQLATGHIAQLGPMCVDSSNEVIYTSDIRGYVKAWNMKQCHFKKDNGGSFSISELFSFRAHHETIAAMVFINEKRLLLTTSIFGTSYLWTDIGVKIGRFGQLTLWSLSSPETWSTKKPKYVSTLPVILDLDSLPSSSSSSNLGTGSRSSGSQPSDRRISPRARFSDSVVQKLTQVENQGAPSVPKDFKNAKVEAKHSKSREDETPNEQRSSLTEKIQNILGGGPPHLRLDSWFVPLQASYDRRLPLKDLPPLGQLFPRGDINAQHGVSISHQSNYSNRRSTKGQASPPKLSLPQFHFNNMGGAISTVKSENTSARSIFTSTSHM